MYMNPFDIQICFSCMVLPALPANHTQVCGYMVPEAVEGTCVTPQFDFFHWQTSVNLTLLKFRTTMDRASAHKPSYRYSQEGYTLPPYRFR